MLPQGPTRWLIISNVAWLLAGLLAYATRTGLAIGTAIALVAALPGLWQARAAAEGQERMWLDRGASYAAGAWAVLAILIVLPYITLEEGGSLWSSMGYHVLLLVVASGGMLAWNATAFQGLAPSDDVRGVRRWAAFHVFVLAGAVWLAAREATTHAVIVRGMETAMLDLHVAPLLAVVPGLVWALAFARTA